MSATLAFGLIFTFVLIGVWIVKGRTNERWLYAAVALLWLPLFLSFAVSVGREFSSVWTVVARPELEQSSWRYCQLDLAQGLGGGLCRLPEFAAAVTSSLPAGAGIGIWPSGLAAHLSYRLYDSFELRELPEAEYVIIYYPSSRPAYENKRLSGFEADPAVALPGEYVPYASFGQGMVIFKKEIL